MARVRKLLSFSLNREDLAVLVVTGTDELEKLRGTGKKPPPEAPRCGGEYRTWWILGERSVGGGNVVRESYGSFGTTKSPEEICQGIVDRLGAPRSLFALELGPNGGPYYKLFRPDEEPSAGNCAYVPSNPQEVEAASTDGLTGGDVDG